MTQLVSVVDLNNTQSGATHEVDKCQRQHLGDKDIIFSLYKVLALSALICVQNKQVPLLTMCPIQCLQREWLIPVVISMIPMMRPPELVCRLPAMKPDQQIVKATSVPYGLNIRAIDCIVHII